MVESKNLKLKLGLCGLALTSFLALNARGNTVHADTVNSGNANAITWDSDQDDSQVVHEDSNQSQPTQNAQGQAPAAQSVQSNVQDHAETSAVCVSNFDTSAVNRNNAQNIRAQANQVKVANVHATVDQHVQISNPQNNQIIVHYVKSNGQTIDDPNVKDQTIDVTKTGNGQYAVPKGYAVAKGTGGYNISVGKASETISDFDVIWNDNPNMYRGQEEAYHGDNEFGMDLSSDNSDKTNKPTNGGEFVTDVDVAHTAIKLARNALTNTNRGNLLTSTASLSDFTIRYESINKKDVFLIMYASENDPTGIWHGSWFQRAYITSDVHNLDQDTSVVDTNPDNLLVVDTNPDDFTMAQKLYDYWTTQRVNGGLSTIHKDDLSDKQVVNADAINSDNKTWPEWEMFYGRTNGKQFASDATYFTDGGSAMNAVGNYINVPVTKPQNVDPNSSDCRRQAQRVIHVTFPNGVKPKSYDSITDSKGNKLTLDGNNDLVQTVTFTRSKTVDSLTGATLNQTSWQQHGAINAVTLPAIPGYTMTQTK